MRKEGQRGRDEKAKVGKAGGTGWGAERGRGVQIGG